ncbi:MAG: InlB B-repeat-containing protein [Candidatus Izimaplasma sp.]|nr:InlB B-repeat-containing protein [Candidatus Izimaplasma bacterium]
MKKIKFLCLSLLLIFMLIGCNENNTPPDDPSKTPSETTTYTIHFETGSEVSLDDVTNIHQGELVVLPTPFKEGHTFLGWSYDTQTYVDFLTFEFNENVTLSASWEKDIYTVTFLGKDNEVLKEDSVYYNETAVPPTPPTYDGYQFLAWDSSYETITEDIVITALYETVQVSLKTKEKDIHNSLYGNTNGNVLNGGRVTYNVQTKTHYYSVGNTVFAYNPETNQTTTLFSVADEVLITHLTLRDTTLYFLTTNTHRFMQYDLTTQTIETLLDNDTYFIIAYDNYIHLDYVKTSTYYSDRVLGLYYHEDHTLYTQHTTETTNVNLYYSKILYVPRDTAKVDLRAHNFLGRMTLKDFSAEGIEQIESLLVLDMDSSFNIDIIFIGQTDGEQTLLRYQTTTGLTTLEPLSNTPITGLNYDGESIYYVKNSVVIQYNLETDTTNEIITTSTKLTNLYIINYWLYFTLEGDSNLYRIHPDTNDIETLMNN